MCRIDGVDIHLFRWRTHRNNRRKLRVTVDTIFVSVINSPMLIIFNPWVIERA